MGFFSRDKQEGSQPSLKDIMSMAKETMAEMKTYGEVQQQTAGMQVGSMPWVRKVMSIMAPAPPGFVKRCTCAQCGAPKKLPSVTAYVYCDYCGSLADFDLRRASEGDTMPGPAYVQLINGLQPQLKAAQAAGERDAYRKLQAQIYEAYVENVPMAVSHRAKNDPSTASSTLPTWRSRRWSAPSTRRRCRRSGRWWSGCRRCSGPGG